MDFWIVLGAVGSVASVVGVLLPLQTRHQRVVHIVYGLAITLLSATSVWYWQQNSRARNVERAASAMVSQASMNYTNEGFVLAALAFLEKNKDLYPDAYSRAHNMCLNNGCVNQSNSSESTQISFAFQGLLRGIGTIEGVP